MTTRGSVRDVASEEIGLVACQSDFVIVASRFSTRAMAVMPSSISSILARDGATDRIQSLLLPRKRISPSTNPRAPGAGSRAAEIGLGNRDSGTENECVSCRANR